MNFKDFLNRGARPASGTVERMEPRRATARTRDPATEAPARGPATDQKPESIDEAVRMLKTIQEFLGEKDDAVLSIPCQALLRQLPEKLRGEKWTPHSFPALMLEIPRDATIKQLKKGRITFPLGDFLTMLPRGWVVEEPDTLVSIDLAMVVQAIPPEWFQVANATSQQVDAVRHMPDYFKPAPATPPPVAVVPAPTVPATPEISRPAAEPPPAPAMPPAATERQPLRPGEWNGIESATDAGAMAIDINRASEPELQKLPGIGALRAQAIVHYRQSHGPFISIFDLADVPGIGRKLFRQTTGLTFRRKDRHDVLNSLLGLSPEDHPTLPQMIEHVRTVLAAAGCVLSNSEGIPLAASGLGADDSARYAALVPQLFRRSRRYLAALDPSAERCLVMALETAPLLLYQTRGFFLVAVLPPGQPLDAAIKVGRALARELDWLMGCRAVVRT